MVQGIDNLTLIRGTITSRAPHPRLADYETVSLAVDSVEAIEGRADLLSVFLGKRLELAVRSDLLGDAGVGAMLRCRAKRTPDGAMCEPHPDPGDFDCRP